MNRRNYSGRSNSGRMGRQSQFENRREEYGRGYESNFNTFQDEYEPQYGYGSEYEGSLNSGYGRRGYGSEFEGEHGSGRSRRGRGRGIVSRIREGVNDLGEMFGTRNRNSELRNRGTNSFGQTENRNRTSGPSNRGTHSFGEVGNSGYGTTRRRNSEFGNEQRRYSGRGVSDEYGTNREYELRDEYETGYGDEDREWNNRSGRGFRNSTRGTGRSGRGPGSQIRETVNEFTNRAGRRNRTSRGSDRW